MDYCGVAYITFESVEDSSWKWRILTSSKGKIKIGGEAASREAAVKQAHDAIGEALRANARPHHEAHMPLLADDALHILHGARSLPLGKAVEALQPFLNAMRHRIPGADRLADASADAVTELVRSLEARGSAADDAWQAAIESTLSFANEAERYNSMKSTLNVVEPRSSARARKLLTRLHHASSGLPRTLGPNVAIVTMTMTIADVIRPNTPPTPASRST